MSLHEIVLPETKPETEWVLGRALRKMSPTSNHAFLQMELGIALSAWAKGKGKVGPEWRFRISPPGEIARPLVPDLAYVSNERLRALSDEDFQSPPLAPDVAVEICLPGDRDADIEDKIGVYLAAGSSLIILVDPAARSVTLVESGTRHILKEGESLEHPALPGFSLPLAELFAVTNRPL